MDSTMKDLKEWLVTKCRLTAFHNTLKPPDPNDGKFGANIVTPHSIPEFVIPGSNESSRNPSICSSDDMRSHSSGMSVTCSPSTSPAVSPRNSVTGLAVPEKKSPVRVRSAPVTPRRDSHGFLRDFGVRSFSIKESGAGKHHQHNQHHKNELGVEQTHSAVISETGPSSSSSSSSALPPRSAHRVNSGFSSLKETSSTSSSSSQRNPRRQSLNQKAAESEARYNRGFMRRPFRSHESLFANDASGAASVLPEHSCISSGGSPRRCSPVMTDQNDYLPLRESFRRSQRYYRRRSSLAQSDMTAALWRQNSDLGFGCESPSRRIPVSTLQPVYPSHSLKRHSAPSAAPASCETVPASSGSNEEHDACSSGVTSSASASAPASREAERPLKEQNGPGKSSSSSSSLGININNNNNNKTATERGDIKFSFQYFPASRRLKLLLIRAENLRFPERPDIVTNPFFKVTATQTWLRSSEIASLRH